jgi:hypothetical protein
MKHNSGYDIDALIKTIYQSYIDIKSKDFDEIQKDMLLDNIKLLYSFIKSTPISTNGSSPSLNIDAALEPQKQEIENNIAENPIDLATNTEIPSHNPIENQQEPILLEEETDKSTTSSAESTIIIEPERTAPANLLEENEFSILKEPAEVDASIAIQDNIESAIIPQINKSDDLDASKQEVVKTTLNSSNIADYLKKEVVPKRDIYDYIDINTRIGLVEIFFKGNSIDLTECLALLNKSTNLSECMKILNMYSNQYGIVETDDIYATFLHLIERKLNNN